jgi:hypothetical protein
MRNRKLLLFALLLLLAYAGARTVMAGLTAQKVLPMAVPENMGMDNTLLGVVQNLEREIAGRMAYEVDIDDDPLKLTRIIKAKGRRGLHKAEIMESLSALRLSCTIISPEKKTAIIKHLGKSYIVSVGDEIAGRQIIAIDKKKIVVRYRGRESALYNRPAPLAEIKYETKIKLDNVEL